MILRGSHHRNSGFELHRNASMAWGRIAALGDDDERVVTWRCLPPDEYCNCGAKHQRGLRANASRCRWVHFNCLKTRAKRRMMVKMGLWFIDSEE